MAVLPRRRRAWTGRARRCHKRQAIATARGRRETEAWAFSARSSAGGAATPGRTASTRQLAGQAGRHRCRRQPLLPQSKGIGPLGVPRRWVIYTNLAEASQVPPDWHGWLHYLVDKPPTQEEYRPRPWQKPHRMNMTGTRRGLSSARQHPRHRHAAPGDRRLQALAAALIGSSRSRWRHAVAISLAPARSRGRFATDGTVGNAQTANRHLLWPRQCPRLLASAGAACVVLASARAPAAAQRIENSVAIFAALDKVTAKISRLEVPLNQTRHVRRAQDHAARLLHAGADRAAQDHHLRGGRRGCSSTARRSASSRAGCLPTAPASMPSSIRCSTCG